MSFRICIPTSWGGEVCFHQPVIIREFPFRSPPPAPDPAENDPRPHPWIDFLDPGRNRTAEDIAVLGVMDFLVPRINDRDLARRMRDVIREGLKDSVTRLPEGVGLTFDE
jgi:hypothetical protein